MKIVDEQIDSMTVRAPQDGIITTWEPQKTLKGRPVEIGTELLQIAAVAGEWVMEVEVPDDDMGPILEARSRLEKEIADGTRPAGLDPGSLLRHRHRPRAPLPRLRPPDRRQGRDGRDQARRQGHRRLHRQGPRRLPQPEPDPPPGGRGPGPRPVRRGPPGLRPAPRRRPRLLRDRAVPLAVPQVIGPGPPAEVAHRRGAPDAPASPPTLPTPSPRIGSLPSSLGASTMFLPRKAAALSLGLLGLLSAATFGQPSGAAGRRPDPGGRGRQPRLARQVRRLGAPRGRHRQDGVEDRRTSSSGAR